jgi:molecular chaperone Hsp33
MTLQERNDHLIQAMDAAAGVRILAAVTTGLVDEARRRHRTTPTSTAAFGRTLTGALLLGRSLKEIDRLTIQIRCDGPIGGITAEANTRGTARGYVLNPLAEAPLNSLGKLDVRAIVGNGTLHAMHESGFELGLGRGPYYGSVPLVSGEIAEDLAHYLAVSEQINSVVALGVYVEPEEGRAVAAGGYIAQLLPGASDEVVERMEQLARSAVAVTSHILAGKTAYDLVTECFGEFELTLTEEIPVEFRCTCSFDRALRLVGALGQAEVMDMLEQDRGAELTCHFCNEVYSLNEADLEGILAAPDQV